MHHPIYLFRHGETHWNAEKRAQGYLDSPLTPAGRAQAEAMGRRLAEELRHHVKSRLAPYKYPRWIEFIDELPKTATGKIQRYKLRQRAA